MFEEKYLKEKYYLFHLALLTDSYMVVSYADKPKIDYIYFEKRLPTPDSIKKLEKLTAFNPKVYTL